jgi:type 1 fimbriae regulatory protein FimE
LWALAAKGMQITTQNGIEFVDSHKRARRYLTPEERRSLLAAAKASRWGARDHALVLLAYRHGLRCAEIISLRWEDVKLAAAQLFVQRAKDGRNAPHPMAPDEVKAVRELWKAEGRPESGPVFATERHGAFSRDGVNKLVERIGKRAGIPWRVFPHSLRHTTGYEMVNNGVDIRKIQAWLGHKQIASTVIYSELDERRFAGITWRA